MLLWTIILSFVVLLLAVAGMAVGVMVSGRRIKGSCGGLSALPDAQQCGVCGRALSDMPQGGCGKQGPDVRA